MVFVPQEEVYPSIVGCADMCYIIKSLFSVNKSCLNESSPNDFLHVSVAWRCAHDLTGTGHSAPIPPALAAALLLHNAHILSDAAPNT